MTVYLDPRPTPRKFPPMPIARVVLILVGLCLAAAAPAAEPLPEFVKKVQLWNCGGAEPTADGKGVMLYRLPQTVRDALDKTSPDGKEKDGAKQMRVAAHSEIRFVLEEGEELARRDGEVEVVHGGGGGAGETFGESFEGEHGRKEGVVSSG